LYEIYGTPQPPVLPPTPPPPPPPPPTDFDVQVASLKAAIVKWQKLLDDAASSPVDKERAKTEIELLQSSLQKLLDSQDPSKPKPPVVPVDPLKPPVDPPKPCLGAYLDASGQIRNACDEVKPPVVPVDPPKPPVNPEIGGPIVCLALNCPKPADTVPPSAPEKPVASKVTIASFHVSWTASKDNVAVTGYNVYLDKKFVATVKGTTYNFAGLKSNTIYVVTILAFDAAKNRSPLSMALSVKTTPPPDTTPPSIPDMPVVGTVTKSGFQITWKPVSDNVKVAGYNVYRNGVYSGTVTTPSFTFRNLSANSNHVITVMAFDDAKNRSVLSRALTVKTTSN
jgi:chitodextrinase